MPAMPTQPTLPFQDSLDPPPAPEPVSATTGEAAAMPPPSEDGGADRAQAGAAAGEPGGEPVPEQAELPIDADPRDRPAHRPAARSGQPWWGRLLGKLLEPWIVLKIEPAAGPQVDRRPVCYVLEDYGLSNALILDRACRETGLPSPLRPLPGDPLGRKRAYVALSRRHANTLKALGITPGPPQGRPGA